MDDPLPEIADTFIVDKLFSQPVCNCHLGATYYVVDTLDNEDTIEIKMNKISAYYLKHTLWDNLKKKGPWLTSK